MLDDIFTTIHSTNMNLEVSQYKNYWKWGYSTLSYHFHISRYTKCNRVYLTEYHREKAWCCKKNKLKCNLSQG